MATTNSRPVTSSEIVQRYLGYFRARAHHEIAGSPLVMPGSGTSFVVAGMQPLLPYLLGRAAPPASRLVGLQRCLRTDDADAVGTNARKLSSFHMLGNWSIGDYNRRGAIELALGLLLEDFGLDRDILWVTTFAGDDTLGLPPDDEAVAEWRRAGVPPARIVPLGMDDNFWSTGGPGACGPCSEIYVDRGAAFGCGRAECRPGCACDRFLEVWNLVFIEHELLPDGTYTRLPLRSVDTGMGLERIGAVLQDVPSAFDVDVFVPAHRRLDELVGGGDGTQAAAHMRSRRLVLDHTRSALFAGLAGVVPGRDGRGSVLRGLIRRAARQGRILGLEEPFLGELVAPLAEGHRALLTDDERARVPELACMLGDEERFFQRTLTVGLRELARVEPDGRGVVSGERLFTLHTERGFPADLAAEILAERGLAVDWAGYERALAQHRAISRASAERRFRNEAVRTE
jgi:alanyl-tRNA synthetase